MSFLRKLGAKAPPTEPEVVQFGEWLPDIMALNSSGAVEALNVIPTDVGYAPFRDIAVTAGLTLPNSAKGGIVVKDLLENLRFYAADTNHIYLRNGAGFDVLFTSAAVISDLYTWAFVPFGDNLVALHPQIAPQVVVMSTSAAFAPLGGAPPIARCGARVGDFLVLGNLDGEIGGVPRQPRRIRWNGFNRIDLPWVTDPTVQSDFQDMPSEGGAVMGVVGLETGTIFQETMISRMSFVGLPAVFSIATAENKRGAICPGGIVPAPADNFTSANIYFIAEDGFFVWNGYFSTPIADNKVNKFFFQRLNRKLMLRMCSGIDYTNNCVWWAFPSNAYQQTVRNIVEEDGVTPIETESGLDLTEETAIADAPLTEVMVYSFKDKRWSHAIINCEYMFASPTTSLPVSLDTLFGDLDTDYAVSFDDDSYDLGGPAMAGFDSGHNFGPYAGQTLEAVLDTGVSSGPTGSRAFVSSARPLVDLNVAVATVQAIKSDQLVGGAAIYGDVVAQEINGECPILDEARYMRFRVRIPRGANWTHIAAVEVWRRSTGRV